MSNKKMSNEQTEAQVDVSKNFTDAASKYADKINTARGNKKEPEPAPEVAPEEVDLPEAKSEVPLEEKAAENETVKADKKTKSEKKEEIIEAKKEDVKPNSSLEQVDDEDYDAKIKQAEEYERSLFGDELPNNEEVKSKSISLDDLPEEISAKVNAFETLASDPGIEAYVKYKQNGGQGGLLDFISQIPKARDVNEMKLEDFIEMQAREMGVDDDEIEDAVQEQLERYGTKIEKASALKKFREEYKNKVQSELSQFTPKVDPRYEQAEIVKKNSSAALEAKISKLVEDHKEKPWKGGLLIDEPFAAVIRREAPLYAAEVIDKNGNLVGYDIDKAVEMLTLYHGWKTLSKNIYNNGVARGKLEVLQQRHRATPSDGTTGGSEVIRPVSKEQELKAARESFKNKRGFGK